MATSLINFVFFMFFFASGCLFGMEPEVEAPRVKIQASGQAELFYLSLKIAQQSETLKKIIEDNGVEDELSISLPYLSNEQLRLLLPAMQTLSMLPMTQFTKEGLARQLEKTFADLTPNNQPLSNQQLIEFISGANFFKIPLVEPALKALAQRILNKDDWTQLESLGDKLKNLWHVHPARKIILEGLSFQYPNVDGVIESVDGKNFISWSEAAGTIKVWDKTLLAAEPITLEHRYVIGVIESLDGKKLISWGRDIIKIRDKSNPTRKLITLEHPGVKHVIESSDSKNLISWGGVYDGTIKVWGINNLMAEPISLPHPGVNVVIESSDSKNLISCGGGTIKVWDINNLQAEPITLQHPWVNGVIESRDGNLISWSCTEGTVKVWDKNNLAEPTTLQHPKVDGVIESLDGKSLISWSSWEGPIKIWNINKLTAEPINLEHPEVRKVRESLNGKSLISISMIEGTIKIWDKTNLAAEPITLEHQRVRGAIESLDGNNLISWSVIEANIKIWDANNLDAEPITLEHPGLFWGVIESMDGESLISCGGGGIKIWDMALLDPTLEQINLLLAVYFKIADNQKFELPDEKLSELKATFNTLTLITQASLERRITRDTMAVKLGASWDNSWAHLETFCDLPDDEQETYIVVRRHHKKMG